MTDYVLIVDDDANLLRGLTRALRREPYHVLTARTADEAQHIVRSHPVSVVVSDEHMPGMRGSEMLAWVAAQCPEIERIMMTGQPQLETIRRAQSEGRVYQFFSKPIEPADLAGSIREAIELHRHRVGKQASLAH